MSFKCGMFLLLFCFSFIILGLVKGADDSMHLVINQTTGACPEVFGL